MSDGFVVYLETEDDEKTVSYWNGDMEVEALENSQVYTSRNEAKRTSGEIQSRYTNHDVKVMPVTITIEPKT